MLSAHNIKFLFLKESEFGCNFRSEANFQLGNKCLTLKIVFQADVRSDTNDEKKFCLEILKHQGAF